ncbi:MAG: hypothetical protein AB1489_37230 [Acidobacteriota bacterium]
MSAVKQQDYRHCKKCGKPMPSNRRGNLHLKCSPPSLKIKPAPKKRTRKKPLVLVPLPLPAPKPKVLEHTSSKGIDVVMVDVTPAQAAAWLTNNNYARQRKLRKWHAEQLAEEMRKGRFRKGTECHFGVLNGQLHLVNGQHTLTAITLYGETVTLTIHRTIVKSEDELADLYNHYDIGLKRNLRDAFNASDLAGKTGLKIHQITFLAAGLRVMLAGFQAADYKTITRDDTMQAIINWQVEGRGFWQALEGCSAALRRLLERSPVVAVALVTFRYAPEKAQQFWSELAADDGLRTGSPLKALRDRLINVRINGGGESSNLKVSEGYMCRVVAAAWNAWTEGKEVQVITFQNKTAAIRINLTPYQGNAPGSLSGINHNDNIGNEA